MRVGLGQIRSLPDPAANLTQVADRTAAAAAAGAALVVFPEATMRCFGMPLAEVAEPLDGPWATAVHEIADRHGVVVAAGMFTPAGGGRVHNVLRVVGRGVDAAYTKIHLFDAYGHTESASVAAGHELGLVEVNGVRVGLTVCYDVRFPGLFTDLAGAGAELIVVAASWGAGPGKREQWRLLCRARALDSTCFVAAVDQADPGPDARPGTAPTGVGHSLVASPRGEVIAALGAAPDLLVVEVDPAEVARVRRELPVLANRRR